MAVIRKKTTQSVQARSVRQSSDARRSTSHAVPMKIAEIRQQLGLNQTVFARLLPVSVRSLATLESGTPPTEVVARRLIELKRLIDALTEVMKRESIGPWLQSPNQAFEGLKPLEVIDRGEIDRIWAMIYYLRSGTPF